MPPVPGSKAAAPGVPTPEHGDNSIQRWGLEASHAERAELGALLQRYLDARVEGDWHTVCSLLRLEVRREQERVAGAGCAEAMTFFAADARSSVLREEADIEVLSLRVGGGYAFLVYRRPDGFFAMPLTRERGEWRLLLVAPNPIA